MVPPCFVSEKQEIVTCPEIHGNTNKLLNFNCNYNLQMQRDKVHPISQNLIVHERFSCSAFLNIILLAALLSDIIYYTY